MLYHHLCYNLSYVAGTCEIRALESNLLERSREILLLHILFDSNTPFIAGGKKPARSTLLLYRASFHPYTLPYATVRSKYPRPVFYRKISKLKYNNIIIHQKESIHIKNKYFRSGNIPANDPQHHNTRASPPSPNLQSVRSCV